MFLILTLINVLLFLGWIALYRYLRLPWRAVLAMLPTPMLGFASSYGVYAFNTHFAPPWVAIVMAAAYEVTYVGIAAFANLSSSQVDKGNKIARDAAVISFAQNALAGLVYIQPSVRGYENWGAWSLVVNLPLAMLHAAQVWIAYRAANFTLHKSQTTPKIVNVDGFSDDYLVDEDDGAPILLPAGDDESRLSSQVDPRAAEWSAWHRRGLSYQKISDRLGGSPSKAHIGRHIKLYRESVTAHEDV
jgi:hypothetical protein